MEDSLKQLAATLLVLMPDFAMSAEETVAQIEAVGIDAFLQGAGSHSAALAEAIELLARLERGENAVE